MRRRARRPSGFADRAAGCAVLTGQAATIAAWPVGEPVAGDDVGKGDVTDALRCSAARGAGRTTGRSVCRQPGRGIVTAVSIAPAEVDRPISDAEVVPEKPWITLVWNDPVNLMSYVTYVFLTYFGYSQEQSEKLMLDVHEKGRAVVSNGTREEMEVDVAAMHSYGLWATLQKDD